MRRQAVLAELGRIARFGAVGVAATAVHLCVALTLVTLTALSAQAANLFGFLVAFAVSFLGHYHWSFRSSAGLGRAAPRFFAVSLSAYLGSAALIKLLTGVFLLSREAAVVAACLLFPAITYLAGRLIVFR